MAETKIFSDSFPAFQGICDLVFTGLEADKVKQALQKIKNEIGQLEIIISSVNPLSDVYRINHSPASEWLDIDPLITDLLSLSSDFFDMSSGAFDVCTGALYALWETEDKPTPLQLAEARGQSGFRQLELDAENNRIRFLKEGIQLDFRAIEKAYAAEVVKGLLSEMEISDCIVSFDEEVILALGTHPSGEAWPIGIRNLENSEEFIHEFELKNRFVVSAGTARIDLQGGSVLHQLVISPESGRFLPEKKTVSVSGISAVFAAFIAHIWLILPEHDLAIVAEQLSDIEIFEAEYLADDIKTKQTLLNDEADEK